MMQRGQSKRRRRRKRAFPRARGGAFVIHHSSQPKPVLSNQPSAPSVRRVPVFSAARFSETFNQGALS